MGTVAALAAVVVMRRLVLHFAGVAFGAAVDFGPVGSAVNRAAAAPAAPAVRPTRRIDSSGGPLADGRPVPALRAEAAQTVQEISRARRGAGRARLA